MRILLICLLASCTTAASPAVALVGADAETRYWATQAALLDPNAYALTSTLSGGIDVTVPEGETWYVVNSFAVYFNTPTVVAQDDYPLHKRSGFLRTLDSRRNFMLPSGTRIRSNPAVNDAYIHVCNPSLVWAADERYGIDPRGLYYERLARLESLPIRELVLNAQGGGSIDDDVHVSIPDDFTAGMLIATSVYDVAWATFGRFNLNDEINNTHTLRFANTMLFPFRRDGIGGETFALKKGSTSDGANVGYPSMSFPIGSSTDPAWAMPIKGSANVLYQVLPSDW